MASFAPNMSTISTTLTRGGMFKARVDSHGYLVVGIDSAGTQGTPRTIQDLALGMDDGGLGYLCIAQRTAGSTGPLTNLANLKCCNDTKGLLQTAEKTAGSLESALTPMANMKCRTDQSGNILVCFKTVGTLGPLTDFWNLGGRTDENGYLICAVGP
jgi:hypothetical protein